MFNSPIEQDCSRTHRCTMNCRSGLIGILAGRRLSAFCEFDLTRFDLRTGGIGVRSAVVSAVVRTSSVRTSL